MATKFKLRTQALAAARASERTKETLIEGLTKLHGGDVTAATLCIEGVVDILGTLNARISAGEPILTDTTDARAQRTLTGIIAGAKVLMDHPEAAEAHNLTSSRLRAVIQQADLNTTAAETMLTIAASAPTVFSEVVKMIHTYNTSVKSGDQSVIEDTKREFQRLWLFWQRNTPTVAKPQ